MPLHTLIKIIDDTIRSTGTPYDRLTPREQHTREAMFAITALAPLTGAFIALAFAPTTRRDQPHGCPDFERQLRAREDMSPAERHREWDRMHLHKPLRYHKLVAYWFLSIGIFGTLVYMQEGRTTRTTFVLAVFHNQIEVLLNCLLLKKSYQNSISAAILYGFVMYPIVLFANSMAWVFIGAAVIGGANDFLIVCLLAYGRQWLLAAGALGHVFSAVAVFTCTIDNFGVLPYNLCIFLGLWIHIGLTVAGILYACELHGAMTPMERFTATAPKLHVAHTAENGQATPNTNGNRRPKQPHQRSDSAPNVHQVARDAAQAEEERWTRHFHEENCRAQCYARNPMRHTTVPQSVLLGVLVISLVGAALITVALAFWVPTWGASSWGHASRTREPWMWDIFGDDGRY